MTHFNCPNCGLNLLVRVESEAVQPSASEIRARARLAVWHFLARGGVNPVDDETVIGITPHDAHTRYLYWASQGGFMYLSQRMFSTSALAYGARFKLMPHQKRRYWFPGPDDLEPFSGDVGPVPAFEPWQLLSVREDDCMWLEVLKDDINDLVIERRLRVAGSGDGLAEVDAEIFRLEKMLHWSRDNRFQVPAGWKRFNPPRWALPDTAYSWTV